MRARVIDDLRDHLAQSCEDPLGLEELAERAHLHRGHGTTLVVARLVQEAVTVPVTGDDVVIAPVADTHSQPHEATLQRLRELAPQAILHGGDIGDLAVLDTLREVAPVYAVRGNIDTRARDLPDVLILDIGRLRILLGAEPAVRLG